MDNDDKQLHQHRSLRTTPHPDEPSSDLEERLFDSNDDDFDDDHVGCRPSRLSSMSFRRESSECLSAGSPPGTRTKRGSADNLQGTPEATNSRSMTAMSSSAARTKSFQEFRRESSALSQGSESKDLRKRREKGRAVERRLKQELQTANVEIGRIVVVNNSDDIHHDDDEEEEEISYSSPSFNFPESRKRISSLGTSVGAIGDPQQYSRNGGFPLPGSVISGSLIFPSVTSSTSKLAEPHRSLGDGSTASVSVSTILSSEINKSSSLIFPIGVSSNGHHDGNLETWKSKAITERVNQCEKRKFLKKKELLLDDLKLSADDIPLQLLNETTLGNTLYRLTLRGNRLKAVPDKLVQCLPVLRILDLNQCDLRTLPKHWNLPKLVTLDLSHNLLRFFPEDCVLRGLPELRTLNLNFNRISEITLPEDTSLLSKLEILDLGSNELEKLPEELDQLSSLRLLKLMNNQIKTISRRICEIPTLREIDGLCSNDMIMPPKSECAKGLCVMKRYYNLIVTDEENKKKLKDNLRSSQRQKKGYGRFLKMASSGLKSGSAFSASSSFNGTEKPSAFQTTSSLSTDSHSRGFEQHRSASLDLDYRHERRSQESIPPPVEEDGMAGVAINDTLKVIFVGMEMVGKTSMIRKLIEGREGRVASTQERTIGVSIDDWDPHVVRHFEHIKPLIELQDERLALECGEIGVKFSVWDFAGQQVYHATHELFFSSQSLFIIVWDMGRNNANTFVKPRRPSAVYEPGAYALYDSSDEESEINEAAVTQDGQRLADRALELDIDNKVQFWIDCIQSTCPGSAILPVASFADEFAESERRRRCQVLKHRILMHEERRLNGIKQRLAIYTAQKRANDAEAVRLQTLLCPLKRPTVLFGSDPDPIVQTSAPQYTGFAELTELLLDIATGRKMFYGRRLFQGHVGTRIPRIRLQVRETVREMRQKFKVVEWGFFLGVLREKGITSVEDISDALHFLANIGELSYFGKTLPSPELRSLQSEETKSDVKLFKGLAATHTQGEMEFDDAPNDDTTITTRMTSDESLTTLDELSPALSQFVFLNPLWLVAAVACILRHDLDREIKETRRLLAQGRSHELPRTASFHHAQLNCPIITSEDASLLWQAMPITRKYAERAQEHSSNMSMTPFEFLQILLTEFGVFVPIDLNIDRALFGGMSYQQLLADRETRNDGFEVPPVRHIHDALVGAAQHFFLPSLLGHSEPGDVWTYKTNEAWKATLCHSIVFPDGVPSGLMERFTACVLNVIHIITNINTSKSRANTRENGASTVEGRLVVKEVLCWRKTFFLKLGLQQLQSDGAVRESIVDVFAHLANQNSHFCVGSDYMVPGMHRLIISGRGPVGDGGRRIWKGGYLLVLKCLQRVMTEYEGVEFEENCVCPSCLANLHLKKACSWDMSALRAASERYEDGLHCANGHFVESRFVCGPSFPARETATTFTNPDGIKPVEDLFEAVVIVGLWDGQRREIVRAGSGFIINKKRGLIITAAHTLMEIWNERDNPFGEDCYGLDRGKVVIGVIPRGRANEGEAVFRYFAQIVYKDPNLVQKTCRVDACVLRIVSRLEQDVGGNGEGCGSQAEIFLLNNSRLPKSEQLSTLKLAKAWEREEAVRVIGYNQGGEGLREPGATLNRSIDFARGYVVRLFRNVPEPLAARRDRNFEPNEEVIVHCLTISGHSGGPCVNLQGEVIGILSRADPTENQRCYLVPSSEIAAMVERAKSQQ